jgi:hypothetical protein
MSQVKFDILPHIYLILRFFPEKNYLRNEIMFLFCSNSSFSTGEKTKLDIL